MSAAQELLDHGFVELSSGSEEAEAFARTLGAVPGNWEDLTPKSQADARPHTLSSVYGLDSFPWHMDGAIAHCPPRFMVLHAPHCNETPTELLDIHANVSISETLQRTTLKCRDGTGGVQYLCAGLNLSGVVRYRWDPRTCEPLSRGGDLPDAKTAPDHIIVWSAETAIIVDNWRMLHRRQRVTDRDIGTRLLRRLYVYPTGSESLV
jgi:L-asparagine oxygenase